MWAPQSGPLPWAAWNVCMRRGQIGCHLAPRSPFLAQRECLIFFFFFFCYSMKTGNVFTLGILKEEKPSWSAGITTIRRLLGLFMS